MAENSRAIAYYTKVGFEQVGKFVNSDDVLCYDMLLLLQ